MRRKPTAGPVVFGRWSRPAALVNAGLVQPDLFPLERLLFCARCGQQFIGAHRNGTPIGDSAHSTGSTDQSGGPHAPGSTTLTDTHPTGGAHQPSGAHRPGSVHQPGAHAGGDAGQPGCTCSPDSRATGGTYSFGPDDFLEGDEYALDPHVYGTFCDCRPGPLEAFRVELAVYSETHLHAFDTDEPVPGLTKAHYAILANRFFTRIEVGPTVDHMTFTNRI